MHTSRLLYQPFLILNLCLYTVKRDSKNLLVKTDVANWSLDMKKQWMTNPEAAREMGFSPSMMHRQAMNIKNNGPEHPLFPKKSCRFVGKRAFWHIETLKRGILPED
jgi:hypothetical protein